MASSHVSHLVQLCLLNIVDCLLPHHIMSASCPCVRWSPCPYGSVSACIHFFFPSCPLPSQGQGHLAWHHQSLQKLPIVPSHKKYHCVLLESAVYVQHGAIEGLHPSRRYSRKHARCGSSCFETTMLKPLWNGWTILCSSGFLNPLLKTLASPPTFNSTLYNSSHHSPSASLAPPLRRPQLQHFLICGFQLGPFFRSHVMTSFWMKNGFSFSKMTHRLLIEKVQLKPTYEKMFGSCGLRGGARGCWGGKWCEEL